LIKKATQHGWVALLSLTFWCCLCFVPAPAQPPNPNQVLNKNEDQNNNDDKGEEAVECSGHFLVFFILMILQKSNLRLHFRESASPEQIHSRWAIA
jgi:hypothetical protein